MSAPGQRQRIAVIGSGISGLSSRARPRPLSRRRADRGRSSAGWALQHRRRRRPRRRAAGCRHRLHRPQRSQLPVPRAPLRRARRGDDRHGDELRCHRQRPDLPLQRVHLSGDQPEHAVRRPPQPGQPGDVANAGRHRPLLSPRRPAVAQPRSDDLAGRVPCGRGILPGVRGAAPATDGCSHLVGGAVDVR